VAVKHTCSSQSIGITCTDFVELTITWAKTGETQRLLIPDDWYASQRGTAEKQDANPADPAKSGAEQNMDGTLHDSPMLFDRQVAEWEAIHHSLTGVTLHVDDDASSYDSQSGEPVISFRHLSLPGTNPPNEG
jgi:hypothetical protein